MPVTMLVYSLKYCWNYSNSISNLDFRFLVSSLRVSIISVVAMFPAFTSTFISSPLMKSNFSLVKFSVYLTCNMRSLFDFSMSSLRLSCSELRRALNFSSIAFVMSRTRYSDTLFFKSSSQS